MYVCMWGFVCGYLCMCLCVYVFVCLFVCVCACVCVNKETNKQPFYIVCTEIGNIFTSYFTIKTSRLGQESTIRRLLSDKKYVKNND